MPDLRLRLHDTLTAKVCPLVPKNPEEVRIYCCGPTTYDVAHVGHARAALAPDVLVRHLRAQGMQVTYVRNITDVDDKILARAAETAEPPMELSERMAKLYKEDMALLGCVAPDVEPKVSEHVTEIVALIERLVAVGSAYPQRMSSGLVDVYFSVRSFPGYGKLSKRNLDDQQAGARVEASEEKRDPADFALWKGAAADAWGWDSPWGRGRPGWHIECSAMAARYLGHGLDVHTGGMDLVFPHHENEIAQSEAAHPGDGPFCGLWIHNGFVNADKEKMAKSLGNFVTIRQVYDRNDPEALRYFLLGVHYRGPIAFDTHKRDDGRVVFPGVLEAERRVDYLYGTLARLRSLQVGSSISTLTTMHKELVPFARLAHEARPRVDEALDDDLNTSVALSVVAEVATAANEFADFAFRKKKDSEIAQATPSSPGS
ncbi:MAG: cysteine--tRNA ligase [Polyangiaceae bacterium]